MNHAFKTEKEVIQTELAEAKSVLDNVAQQIPVYISSMVLKTGDGDYGDTIYSKNTTSILRRFLGSLRGFNVFKD